MLMYVYINDYLSISLQGCTAHKYMPRGNQVVIDNAELEVL